MKERIYDIARRLTNTKTVFGIAALVALILTENGIPVDSERVTTTVEAVCGIMVLLGIMNDTGMETTNWNR